MILDSEIKEYIFLTTEGTTFQPGSHFLEPDIENLQVIGFSRGETSKEAFEKLIFDNSYLLETSFNEIFGLELANFSKRDFYFLREEVD